GPGQTQTGGGDTDTSWEIGVISSVSITAFLMLAVMAVCCCKCFSRHPKVRPAPLRRRASSASDKIEVCTDSDSDKPPKPAPELLPPPAIHAAGVGTKSTEATVVTLEEAGTWAHRSDITTQSRSKTLSDVDDGWLEQAYGFETDDDPSLQFTDIIIVSSESARSGK
ncbi:unnamed protein product, partial [Symbiodinium sp. KB8]